jgi:hypothetical protein
MKNVKMNNWVQKSDGKCLDAICLLLELFLPHLPVVGGITAAKTGRFSAVQVMQCSDNTRMSVAQCEVVELPHVRSTSECS